jgi:hypothetical protein
MNNAYTPFVMRLLGPWERAFANEWLPLTLVLERPDTCISGVRVRNVSCDDSAVQLNLDLLDRNLEIRPGETYRLTVPICVTRAKTLELKSIALQVQDASLPPPSRDQLVPLPDRQLPIRPAIDRQIRIQLEPLCLYEEGTKVQLTVTHHGSMSFREFRINLGPEDGVSAGKRTVRRPSFEPGDKEEVEVVLNGNELEVDLIGFVGDQRVQSHRSFPVGRPPQHEERRFHFLEPRRLSIDHRKIYRIGDDNTLQPVEDKAGAFPLRAGQRYQIEIRPQLPGVKSINLHDIPGKLHVRRRDKDAAQGCWKFQVEVTFAELFRQPEILSYEIEGADERLNGEVALCLLPPVSRSWQVAAALGATLTVQGFVALARVLTRGDLQLLDVFSEIDLTRMFNIASALSIPLAWIVLRGIDWLQYRLRT